MKTLILNGSPRPKGDTAYMLGRFKLFTEEDLQIDCYTADISPCIDCRKCTKSVGCAINDGMSAVYDYIRDCDNILIASPIYFSELTGKLLDVASRIQALYCAERFLNSPQIAKPKRGGVILVGGGAGKPDRAYATAKTLLKMMGCTEIHPLVCYHDTDHMPIEFSDDILDMLAPLIEFFANR